MEPQLKKRLEQHLQDLPVLPTAVVRLMALDPRAEDYSEQVIALIESDPNYTTRLIASANSVSSSPMSPVTTLRAAVTRVGSSSVASMVLSMSVVRVFVPKDDWEKSLWRHSLQVAVAARALAPLLQLNREEAYTCGLLHDLGRFVMFQEAPDQLRLVDEGDWSTPDTLIAAERSICGLTHTELGALACTRWHLPQLIVNTVKEHHSPTPSSSDPKVAAMVSLIRFADIAMFPSALPGKPGLDTADDATLEKALVPRMPPKLHLGVRELRNTLRASAAESAELLRTLGLS